MIVAAALAPYEVEAVFLDEPTTGLDPANRAKFWGLIRRMVKGGTKVLVTSHEMEEVEERVEEVVMINKGRLVLHDKPRNILSYFSDTLCIDVLESEKFREVLKNTDVRKSIERVIDLGTVISIYVRKDQYDKLMDLLSRYGLEFKVRKCSLRDTFLWWTK